MNTRSSRLMTAITLSIVLTAACPAETRAATQPSSAVRFAVTVDRGADVGQAFGSLFEAASEDGSLVIGAGFQNAYNTRYRADRHAIQFFIRRTDGQRELMIERLPRPTDHLIGAYLFSRDGNVYSTYGGLKVWNPDAHRWMPLDDIGGTGESMRVGNGTLTFGDSRVSWNGRIILDPPDEGSYQLFYYANGWLCFYHVHRRDRPYRLYTSDGDGFSRLYACPWTPGDGPVDLSRAVTLRLPVVGETTFAWGQLGKQIVTGSNIGGFYVFEESSWRMLLEPRLGVSYQLYSSLAFNDRLLMGQYPTGRVFAYDGRQIADQPGWPPVLPGVAGHSREAQTTAIYGGDLFVGVWPWGEVWRYNPDSRQWIFARRMFDHPDLSDQITHPYDIENREHSPVNLWGQRVTSLVPSGSSLFIATSAKAPYEWQPNRFPFLAPDRWKSYGSVYRATMSGHVSAPTRWTSGATQLEFTVDQHKMTVHQDGQLIASRPLTGAVAGQFRKSGRFRRVSWGSGTYGPFGGQSLKGTLSPR